MCNKCTSTTHKINKTVKNKKFLKIKIYDLLKKKYLWTWNNILVIFRVYYLSTCPFKLLLGC